MSRVAVLLIKNANKPDHYLMGLRANSKKYAFPGGGLNVGEDPKDGAIRELEEETGFKCKNLKLKGVFKRDEPRHIVVYMFECEIYGEPSLKKDPDNEFEKLVWVNPKQLSENELHVPKKQNFAFKII